MNASSTVELPSPPSPSFSRGQRWAARLALLVACIGSVATSKPSSPLVSAEVKGQPLLLTKASPTAVRHIRIQVSEDKPSSRQLDLNLDANVFMKWTSDSPNRAATPVFRARLVPPSDFKSSPSWTQSYGHGDDVNGPASAQTDLSVSTVFLECKPGSTCDWSLTLEIELTANDTNTAQVEWDLTAFTSVMEREELPAGFNVSVTEE